MNIIPKKQEDEKPHNAIKGQFFKGKKAICNRTYSDHGFWDFEKVKAHIARFDDWKKADLEDCLKNLKISVSDIELYEVKEDKQTKIHFKGLFHEGLQSWLCRHLTLQWLLGEIPQYVAGKTVLFSNLNENSPYVAYFPQDPSVLNTASIFNREIILYLKKAILDCREELSIDGNLDEEVGAYVKKLSANIGQKGKHNPCAYKEKDYASYFPLLEEAPSALAFKKGDAFEIHTLDSRHEEEINWGKRPKAYLCDGVDIRFATEANFKAVSSFFAPRFVTGAEGFEAFLNLLGAGLISGASRSVRTPWIAGIGGDGKTALLNLVGAVLGRAFAKGKSEIIIRTGHNLSIGADDLDKNGCRVACFDEFKVEADNKDVLWSDLKTMLTGDNPLEGRKGKGLGSFTIIPKWFSIFSGNGFLKNVPKEHQKPLLDRLAFFEMQRGDDWMKRLSNEYSVRAFEESDTLKGGILYGILQGMKKYKENNEIFYPEETTPDELPVYPWQTDEGESEGDCYYKTPDFKADLREHMGKKLSSKAFYEMGGMEGKSNHLKGKMRVYCEENRLVEYKKTVGDRYFHVLNFPAFGDGLNELPSA